jgi:hypothetical protein
MDALQVLVIPLAIVALAAIISMLAGWIPRPVWVRPGHAVAALLIVMLASVVLPQVGQRSSVATPRAAASPVTASSVATPRAAASPVTASSVATPRAAASPVAASSVATPRAAASPVAASRVATPRAAAPRLTASPVARRFAVNANLPISAVDGGLDTGLAVRRGQKIHIVASGRAQYGYEGGEFGDCNGAKGYGVTDPDGHRTIGGVQCQSKKVSHFPAPDAPIGSLIVRVGRTPWRLAGSETTFAASHDGEVWLGYNDDYPADDRGQFSASLRIAG